jgi:hypothetical protein
MITSLLNLIVILGCWLCRIGHLVSSTLLTEVVTFHMTQRLELLERMKVMRHRPQFYQGQDQRGVCLLVVVVMAVVLPLLEVALHKVVEISVYHHVSTTTDVVHFVVYNMATSTIHIGVLYVLNSLPPNKEEQAVHQDLLINSNLLQVDKRRSLVSGSMGKPEVLRRHIPMGLLSPVVVVAEVPQVAPQCQTAIQVVAAGRVILLPVVGQEDTQTGVLKDVHG